MIKNSNQSFYFLCLSFIFSTSAGILFPTIGILVEPYLLLWLGLLLFFNLIKMDISELFSVFSKPKNLIILTLVKLIIIPVSLYFLIDLITLSTLSRDVILSVFLLSGISTGLGSPFVVNFVGGNLPPVVGIIITTSLLVPFVLPVLVYLVFSSHFSIPLFDMILLLSVALFVPMILSHLVKKYLPVVTGYVNKEAVNLSIAFMFLINFGIFAKYSYFLFSNPILAIENILVAFILFGIYSLAGYGVAKLIRLTKSERISAIISMAYVNNILVVVFAQQFFSIEVAALAAFFNIPYYVGILVLKKIIKM